MKPIAAGANLRGQDSGTIALANYERRVYEPSDEVRVFDGSEEEDDVEGSRLPLLIVLALLVLAMFAFEVPWLLDDEQTVSDLALYPAANEGADLAVSVVGHEGEDLRVRLWLCPPAPRRAAPCDEPEPGVFPHVWLLFERPFFASRTSRWSAAFEGAYPDETGWSTSPTWRDEPALPWAPLPPLREPCDPRLGECLDPTRVDGCATWVPACRALGGDRTWPPEQSFCIDGVHDADDC